MTRAVLARAIEVSPPVGITEQIEEITGTLSLFGNRVQINSARQVRELREVRFVEEMLSWTSCGPPPFVFVVFLFVSTIFVAGVIRRQDARHGVT